MYLLRLSVLLILRIRREDQRFMSISCVVKPRTEVVEEWMGPAKRIDRSPSFSSQQNPRWRITTLRLYNGRIERFRPSETKLLRVKLSWRRCRFCDVSP